MRFMTLPGAPSWTVDVTALRPLLAGEVTLRVFVDTWVGPGHPQGAGWLVDASFEMKGGTPARLPVAVIPLWDEMRFDYGDPAKPVAAAVPPRQPAIPADASAVELRAIITGHGQGNLQNCAEFCRRTHSFRLGETSFDRLLGATTAPPAAPPARPATPAHPAPAGVRGPTWSPGSSTSAPPPVRG